MVHPTSGFEPALGDSLTIRTFPVFFDVLRTLLAAEVSVVAEAAFQDKVWRPNLEPLTELAELRVIQCHTDPETAKSRMLHRGRRGAHADREVLEGLTSGRLSFADFQRLEMNAPSIDVDTTSGYDPPIGQILAFINC